MKDLLKDEVLDDIVQPLYLVANKMSNEVVGIIAERLKECGELLPSDITRLGNAMLLADKKKIEKALSELTDEAISEIQKAFDKVAETNDDIAKQMYEYRKVDQIPYKENDVLHKIVKSAVKNSTDDFLALSNTTTMGLFVNNKFLPFQKAYNRAIDEAVFAIQQGTTDYTTAIRHTITNMATNGITVEYESGYRRRLDSAVRMNVLDGIRQMNISYRDQQGKEYGADAYEISAHINCRPDHQEAQGKVFTFEEFEKLNDRLRTPIATGEMNCKHTRVSVIKAINVPAYSDKELEELKQQANEVVTFTGLSGNELSMSRYNCTQYLRQLEVIVRDKGSVVNVMKRIGDKQGLKNANAEHLHYIQEYKRVCKETGIPERLNRLRTVM